MKYKIKILAVFVFSVCALYMSAESSVKDLVGLAVENREDINISLEQVNLARMRLVNATRFLGPFLVLEYRSSEGETFDDPYRAESYGVRFEQAVFQGGGRYFGYRRERKGVQVAEASHQRILAEIENEVADAYYKVLMHRNILSNYESLISELERDYEIARRQREREIKTEIDYEDISNLKESIRIQKDIAADELAIALMDLRIVCSDPELEVGERELDLVFSPSLVAYRLEDCLRIAFENRPEMKIARLVVSQSEYDERVAGAANYPALTLEGFYGRSGEAFVDRDLLLVDQWSVFLNLRWGFWGNTFSYRYGGDRVSDPSAAIIDASQRIQSREHVAQFSLLDGLERVHSEKEKEVVRMQSEMDLENTVKQIEREVENNLRILHRTMDLVNNTRKRLDVEKRRVEIIDKNRLLGQASLKDVMEARNNVVQVENSLYENIYKFYAASAALNRACGKQIMPVEILR